MSLNREQTIVTEELDKNIILLASAGTGKTETLARRVANIIKSGKAKAEEILCITFTNKACKEMQQRVEEIVGKESKGVNIKTFHSFCFDIIKMEAKKSTDMFTDFIVFDEHDCLEIIKSCNYYNYSIYQLQRFIDFVKMERARLELFSEDSKKDYEEVIHYIFLNKLDIIEDICSEKGNINMELVDFLKNNGHVFINSYNGALYNSHGIDFSDIIIKTRELFYDKDLVRALRNRYKFINIDEVQDTSFLEYSIIEKLFNNNNVLICGDIFQTIYKWRGSEPTRIFEDFKRKYYAEEIVFNKNYRATRNLTSASLEYLKNAFLEEVNEIYKDNIEAFSFDEGEKIKYKSCNSLLDEAYFIINEIRVLEEKGENLNRLCVLTRDNKYNIELSKKINWIINREGANFTFALVDQFRFFRRQEIKDVVAFLKLIANRYDSVSLKRIVERLPTGVGDKTFEEIESDKYRKVGIQLSDYIDMNVIAYGEKYGLLVEEYNNDNIIVFDVESTGVDTTEDEIIQIAAIKVNRNGNVIDKFERFLRNKKSVKNSEHVHGFSDEFLLVNGEDRELVLNDFLKFSNNTVIVGHNVQFDINILASELSRLNLEKLNIKGFFDTLDIYRRFYPNTINHKLETLSRIFDTNHKPTHDAMDDILATKELMVRAIEVDIKPTAMMRIAYMSKHLKAFTYIREKLNSLFEKSNKLRPYDIVANVINDFSIKTIYTGDDGKVKIERLREFYILLKELDDESKDNRDSLLDIIKITGLSNGDLESLIINRSKLPKIPIITVHQAKGLEYDTVFLAGLNEGNFPSYMAIKNNNMDEEKRTFYVAITRAKKRLILSSNSSGLYARRTEISRFIELIPDKYIMRI